ncbi:hybrid sensor histidine kinase/response regulator transcription factor [Ancylomarina sp. 16SWW S1-10-2]|uniref:hybrid sensor histidine kinase/response regulator transcription factor n=1 Tax=Ancylomarina sp. 16SWW S1-10-2 TaxID=2499681 RepID=UPI0012AE4E1E|nr:hybrid sensor histidine kinase/response regulator transcription factor [Ancylomarina sp. 16SWW S1-10-2]MRT92017.1 response regulator [Ancylomarina sp. 16SWW S1-10-2]
MIKNIYKYILLVSIIIAYFLPNKSYGNIVNKESYSFFQLKGLPQNDVNLIYRDSKGFMWIGTLDGLHRFDGYSYKTYRISENPESISSNMIIDIAEDSKGNIWISTYGRGICKLNPITEKFTIYHSSGKDGYKIDSDDITCMTIDKDDVIWVGTWYGYSRITLDKKSDAISEIITVSLKNTSIDDFTTVRKIYRDNFTIVKKIHQDQDGQIWIGTNGRLLRLLNPYANKDQIKYETFKCQAENFCDYEGGFLIGGPSISAVQKQADGSYEISPILTISANTMIYKNQKIWLGNRFGITCLQYNPKKGWQIEQQLNKQKIKDEFPSNIVTCLTEDESGQIWAGTRGGGIYTINLNQKKFHHYQKTRHKNSISSNFIKSVFEDHEKNLWIGTENDGVNFLSRKNSNKYANRFQHIQINPNSLENRAYCIEETLTPKSKLHKSLIWIGTSHYSNLVAIDPLSLKKKPLHNIVSKIGFVFTLESQGDSVLWVGTYGEGLWKFSLDENGDITKYLNFTPDNNSKSHISSRIIRDLLLDKDDNLWISTDKGLNRISAQELNKKDPLIQNFEKEEEIQNDYFLKIYQAKNGKLWMGSMGGGLISYSGEDNKSGHHFSKITEKDGLPNNTIKSILEDDKGSLWLATNKGLSQYNPTNGDIINYDSADGLQHDEFSEICAFKRSNGQFIFGGINGFNVFYPEQITKDTIPPKLFLTDFYILNKIVKPGEKINGKIILKNSLEYTDHIELNYQQNSFSIGFLGLHYTTPQKNKYKYTLEGFDQAWYNATASYRIAKYTNIPAGEYTFKVMASNSDNIWVEKPKSIKIKINPPFYFSAYAYLVYALLILIGAYIAYRMLRLSTLRKKDFLIAEMEKNKVEEIAQIKLRFFTNISHDFRTPLTLITTPLAKLISKGAELSEEERQGNYKLINQNANFMLRLINQLMDFRRLEQDLIKLSVEDIELNQFINNIIKTFEPLAEQKNITLLFEGTDNDLIIWADAGKIEKVTYNLLSNAFKFTPKDGSITIEIEDSEQDNSVRIFVSDTGIGISGNEQKLIFERYYQSTQKDKQSYGGTGIGLALCKGLIDMHKGTIEVSSSKDKGTSFTVKLHKGKSWMSVDSLKLVSPQTEQVHFEDEKEESLVKLALAKEVVIKKNHYKILLVEDNIDLREVIADIFNDYFIVFQANDGVQGFEKCMNNHPDVIISDVMMPNMNGIELCRKIKEEEAVSHIPVLLLTAKNTIESQLEGFKTGADAYIPKPFNTDILKARVISLINNRENLRKKFQKEIEINPMIIANSPADAKFLEQILALIEKNISDSNFSVEKLAGLYGVSRIYLNRKIKALTAETSNEFLRNIRLKHAAELLSQNVLTVSEVTWQVGYNDLRTFRTRFKEKFGISPSEYAKSKRPE